MTQKTASFALTIFSFFLLKTSIASSFEASIDFNGVDQAYLERIALRANRTGHNYKYVKIGDHGGVFIPTDPDGNELTYGIHENELQLVQVSTARRCTQRYTRIVWL